MPEIMIARRPGWVRIDGQRRMVKKGVTTAHADHPIVADHPRLWQPLAVTYPSPAADAGDTEKALTREWLRLRDGLAERGVELPEGAEQDPPWFDVGVVDAALEAFDRFRDRFSAKRAADGGLDVTTLEDRNPVTIALDDPEDPAEPEPDPEDPEDPEEPPAEPVDPNPGDPPPPGEGRLGRNARIREWAAANGIEVSPRGKIPAPVVKQYEAAVAVQDRINRAKAAQKAAQGG